MPWLGVGRPEGENPASQIRAGREEKQSPPPGKHFGPTTKNVGIKLNRWGGQDQKNQKKGFSIFIIIFRKPPLFSHHQ